MTSLNETALPRRFRQTSYGALEIRDGGGILTLLGLPLLLGGAAVVALFTRLLPLQVQDGKWAQPGFILMGLAFLLLGTMFVFGRQWLTRDPSRGLVVLAYGLLVPMRTREWSLSEFSGVLLHRVRGDSESVDRYPVQLQARIGKHLTISHPSNFGEARQQAEYLARWLRLPLTDETTDHPIVIAAERAGDSLHQRSQSETAEAAPPELPKHMRSRVFDSGSEVKIVIPGGSNMPAGIVAALFIPIMLLAVFPLLRRLAPNGTGSPLPVLLLIVAIFAVPETLLLVALIASKRKKTTVKASPAGLEIELGKPWGAPVKMVPADQILDLDFSTFEGALRTVTRSYAPGSPQVDPPRGILGFLAKRMPGDGIIVKSKQDWISFGEQLPVDELRYLAWLLRKTLAAPRK